MGTRDFGLITANWLISQRTLSFVRLYASNHQQRFGTPEFIPDRRGDPDRLLTDKRE
jgi:hypothetical protein